MKTGFAPVGSFNLTQIMLSKILSTMLKAFENSDLQNNTIPPPLPYFLGKAKTS